MKVTKTCPHCGKEHSRWVVHQCHMAEHAYAIVHYFDKVYIVHCPVLDGCDPTETVLQYWLDWTKAQLYGLDEYEASCDDHSGEWRVTATGEANGWKYVEYSPYRGETVEIFIK